MLCSEWFSSWLVLRRAALAPRTIDCYLSTWRLHIAPALGALALADVQPAHIVQLLAGIAAEGHTRTAQLVHAILHKCLADAVRQGLLSSSPMEAVPRPAHRRRQPQWLTPDQIPIYVAAAAADKYRLAWLLALCCGLRRGEICGLRWSDIDFTEGVLHVQSQRQRLASGELVDLPPKSAAGTRQIPLPPQILAALKAQRQLFGYVVPITPSGLDKAHRLLLAAAGLPPIRLHDIRHTMGAVAIRQQVPIKVLQVLLGHADYSTTANIYAHVDAQAAASAIASIAANVL